MGRARRRWAFGHPVALRTGLWGGVQSLGQAETTGLVALALLIGLGAGFGAVGFRALIDLFHAAFFGASHALFGALGPFWALFAPALGGLLVGPIVYRFAREAKGHGVPEVIAAIALQGGRIRPRVVVVKALASAISIGSGGSVGREGPIVQIGSALGSTLGQLFRMSEARVRLLLACGAAGGIAATFNAPIAGVFFALEVILAEFETRAFSMIVISAVVAAVIGRVFFGNHPAFQVPSYQFVSPLELLPYAALGVLAGLVAVVFIRVLYGMEDLWDRWAIPEYLKPIPGGLLMGAIGLLAYRFQAPSPAGAADSYLFGVGYNGIEPALFSQLPWAAMLLFLVLKLLATSVTIGSGGSGGVFSPSLFVGAMLGGVFGTGVHALFPSWTAQPGAYAMVGMGALFAGAAHAPITAVLILFEMTDNYTIILPLMLAVVIATLLAQRLSPDSIYLLKLVRRGVQARRPRAQDILETIPVAELMTSPVATVPATLPLEALAQQFERSGQHGFPVVDEDGALVGVVTLGDVQQAVTNEAPALTVADVMTRQVLTAFPDESVHQALTRFGAREVGRIPVVERADPRRVVGILRRADIVGAYGRAIADQRTTQTRAAHLRARDPAGAHFLERRLAPASRAVGRAVRDLGLPTTAVLVAIDREGRTIIPRGDVRLAAGDQVLLLATMGSEAAVDAVLAVSASEAQTETAAGLSAARSAAEQRQDPSPGEPSGTASGSPGGVF